MKFFTIISAILLGACSLVAAQDLSTAKDCTEFQSLCNQACQKMSKEVNLFF